MELLRLPRAWISVGAGVHGNFRRWIKTLDSRFRQWIPVVKSLKLNRARGIASLRHSPLRKFETDLRRFE